MLDVQVTTNTIFDWTHNMNKYKYTYDLTLTRKLHIKTSGSGIQKHQTKILYKLDRRVWTWWSGSQQNSHNYVSPKNHTNIIHSINPFSLFESLQYILKQNLFYGSYCRLYKLWLCTYIFPLFAISMYAYGNWTCLFQSKLNVIEQWSWQLCSQDKGHVH